MHLTREGDVNRLDFDFHGHGGYAIARRELPLDLPANYQFTFRVRGETLPQTLEFKLVRGDDVWWMNRRDFSFPREWKTLTTKKRQISFAWGPAGGGEPRHIDSIEVVVTAASGGKGTVWFTDPLLEELPLVTNEIGGLIIDCAACTVPDALQERAGGRLFVWLPDAPAETPRIIGETRSVTTQPPSWAPGANDFYAIVAKAAPRGAYPRYFLGEQSYWTVIGADGADSEALVSEDGAVEPFKGGESIEPFLHAGGRRLTWADVEITQSLAEDELPIPSVTWRTPNASMTMTAAVSSSSMLQLRYRVRGDAEVELQVRPFQVNPSTQFLNLEGGVARESRRTVILSAAKDPRPNDAMRRGSFVVCATQDDSCRYRSRDFEIDIPLEKGAKREPFANIAAEWREKLHRVDISIAGAPEIANTIRTNLAYTLIHRDGPALQPGSRSYERSWIRDGALMSALLLRLGHADVAKQFAEWFASHQYDDGKVPCCVDRRGADPVPENDSHGELIYLIREVAQITHDEEFAKRMQPHVEAAARYIEELRSQNHGEFEGLVTESISHEGYSAKPVHSYWDDVFCLKGADTPDFRADLMRSIRQTIEKHHLDFIPASVELADFDPTSTSIALSPLGLMSLFPEKELRRTYEKYLTNISHPRADYTPYEMRNIAALIRLGEKNRALQLVDRFLLDRRPRAWNQWAEVVRTEYRKAGFIGDMPHAWVASDFTRSILEAIVYEREDGTLVIGAGVPKRWLPVHVGPLATSQGLIDVRIDRTGTPHVKHLGVR